MTFLNEDLTELRVAVDRARWLTANSNDAERIDLEQDMCLASRGAYLDLYTDTVAAGVIDQRAAFSVIRLFLEALYLMHDGEYKDSMENRFEDLQRLCAKYRRSLSDVTVIALDGDSSWEVA